MRHSGGLLIGGESHAIIPAGNVGGNLTKKLCVGFVLVLVVIFSFQTIVNGQWPAGVPKPDSSIPDPPHAWVDVSGDGTIANPWAIVYSDTEVQMVFGT